jgi:hypothetical protein
LHWPCFPFYPCISFAVAVVLHLVEGKEVNVQTFTQSDITKLRKKLAKVLASNHSVQELAGSKTVSEIVRDCFPALRGTSIVDTFGVETIGTIVNSAATVLAKIEDEGEVLEVWTATEGNGGSDSQRKAAEAKSVDEDDNFDFIDDNYHDDDDSEDSDDSDDSDDTDDTDDSDDTDNTDNGDDTDSEDKVKESDKGNVSSIAGSTTNKAESSLSGNSEDTLLYSIMKEANVVCFPTLEDATPIIEAYEVQSGNSLAIQRSLHDKFRLFRCREHIDCPF